MNEKSKQVVCVSNCVNACQNLGRQILVLEGDNDVFIKVLEFFSCGPPSQWTNVLAKSWSWFSREETTKDNFGLSWLSFFFLPFD
jgi:hypothetical protein